MFSTNIAIIEYFDVTKLVCQIDLKGLSTSLKQCRFLFLHWFIKVMSIYSKINLKSITVHVNVIYFYENLFQVAKILILKNIQC